MTFLKSFLINWLWLSVYAIFSPICKANVSFHHICWADKPRKLESFGDGAIKAERPHHKVNGPFANFESQTVLLAPVISKATSSKTTLVPLQFY